MIIVKVYYEVFAYDFSIPSHIFVTNDCIHNAIKEAKEKLTNFFPNKEIKITKAVQA